MFTKNKELSITWNVHFFVWLKEEMVVLEEILVTLQNIYYFASLVRFQCSLYLYFFYFNIITKITTLLSNAS